MGPSVGRRGFLRLAASAPIAAAIPAAALARAAPAAVERDRVGPNRAELPLPAPRVPVPPGILTRLPDQPLPGPGRSHLHTRAWRPWRAFILRFHGVRLAHVGHLAVRLDHSMVWEGTAELARLVQRYHGAPSVPRGHLMVDFGGSSINHELVQHVDLELEVREGRGYVSWWALT